jgi:methyl-accepting chemotaxis protein
MSQLDTVTQQNSAASEQTANAAEELSAQAASLKNAVQDLIFTVKGSSAQPNQPSSKIPLNKEKTSLQTGAPKNVVPFTAVKGPKKTNPAVAAPAHSKMAKAPERQAADGSIPSHDHAGFKEV